MLNRIKLPVHRGMRTFFIVLFGQVISITGSDMTSFALGVWVYQRTGSATQFALISLFIVLPNILMSPLAGALVDRWNRRWAMILSDSSAAITTLAIALLVLADSLEIWHIYLAVAISSTFQAFHEPAASAAITQLVPKQHFGRASGMIQVGMGLAQIFSPMLGGILLVTIGLQGVILLDVATFICALVILLLVRFPDVKTTETGKAGRGTLLHEAVYGWRYLKDRPGLLGLLILFAVSNFMVGIVAVLFTPLVLSLSSAAVLGTILSVGGIGMLMGGLVMSIWGGPQRLIYGVLGFLLLGGVSILVVGFHTIVLLLAVSVFLFSFSTPFVGGCSQAIWLKKVAPDIQGRVFAMRQMIAGASLPLAFILAGPLADYVFEPLMAANGYLAGSIGQIIGTGPGRGIGLLFIVMGTLTILTIILAYQFPRLRLVEDDLPDVVADSPDNPTNQ